MLCALPVAARRSVYRAYRETGDVAHVLDDAWLRNGAAKFRCNSDPYAYALMEATRADVRRAVAELLGESV